MEQNTPATMPVIDSGKQSDGKGLKIATIVASVMAVCGIGFGVYGMIQSSQKDSQISDLKAQIKDSSETATTAETSETETNTDSNTTTANTDSPETTELSESATTTDVYKNFANNLAKNDYGSIYGYYYHWTGSTNERRMVSSYIKDSHLVIRDSGNGDVVIAEADGIISAHYIQLGNGGVPYIYLIKKDGTVARINISEDSSRTIEDLNGYEKIVSIYGASDFNAHLIDINGNIYKNS